jgi:hypothetical protein
MYTITKKRTGKHVSVVIWLLDTNHHWVLNKHSLGYENERCSHCCKINTHFHGGGFPETNSVQNKGFHVTKQATYIFPGYHQTILAAVQLRSDSFVNHRWFVNQQDLQQTREPRTNSFVKQKWVIRKPTGIHKVTLNQVSQSSRQKPGDDSRRQTRRQLLFKSIMVQTRRDQIRIELKTYCELL